MKKQRKKFQTIQLSAEIMLDPKKKENYVKYGNPNGPDSQFWEDKYPDFVVNPGKPLLIFYASISFLFTLLPLSLFFGTFTKNPPEVFKETVIRYIKIGEEHLVKGEEKESFENFDHALKNWNELQKPFKKYGESIFDAVIKIRIATRKAQHYLIKKEIAKVKKTLQDCRDSLNKNTIKSAETNFYTKGFIEILSNSISTSDFSKSVRFDFPL